MIAFAAACDAIAATPARLGKRDRLAAYFRSLGDADLAAAARFFAGHPLPPGGARKLAVGGSTILRAAREVWGIDDRALSAAYRATGDLGAALSRFVRPALDLGLFRETLTPAGLGVILSEIASAAGGGAGKRRLALCENLLRACRTAGEAAYAVKILTGDLRIGLGEGLVPDALAAAFERDPAEVRRAAMAAGDLGAVALAARADALRELTVRYGAPIGFMLASPIAYGPTYDLPAGGWYLEDKFDGMRAQAHVRGGRVQLFSRTQTDVARAFPEIAAALGGMTGDAIFDGEIVAQRNGAVLPFRYLQTRLQRVAPERALLEEIPAVYVAFDILADNETFLIDLPLAQRRTLLSERVAAGGHVRVAEALALEDPPGAVAVNALFEAARARGNEGLMFKRADAPYAPGRRGKWWLKLKRELTTLDVVVVGVEWGHGKRHKVLSDYTFAVRAAAESDELLTIGKAYSGLTDAEIAALTPWFLEHQTGRLGAHALAVEPGVVIEVAFDVVQKSTLHASGYALRFPRIVRLRSEKPASQIDTLADVERIYALVIEREGVPR